MGYPFEISLEAPVAQDGKDSKADEPDLRRNCTTCRLDEAAMHGIVLDGHETDSSAGRR
jgi:hypothetical protein